MERRELTFRVFDSSTFNDLKAVRDALQRDVFPRLRANCQKHGCRFQAIDQRWASTRKLRRTNAPCGFAGWRSPGVGR
jgi:hypothetical protein